jgi:thiamine-phosphate pyrophosphorylase
VNHPPAPGERRESKGAPSERSESKDSRSTAWSPRGAILCLVTPGLALPFAVATVEERTSAIVALVRDAVGAGIDLVQIREPDLPGRLLARLVDAAVEMTRGTPTRVIVNDRVDVAIACHADGAHLGGRSLPTARVRDIAPSGFLVGRSIHTVEEARAAAIEGMTDYLVAGTVFPSASKPDERRLLGVEGLAAVVRASARPVLAIGGVDLDTIAPVAATGARGFAAIRFFADAAAGARLRETVARARETFDTARVIP